MQYSAVLPTILKSNSTSGQLSFAAVEQVSIADKDWFIEEGSCGSAIDCCDCGIGGKKFFLIVCWVISCGPAFSMSPMSPMVSSIAITASTS
jgi:hypothetical protein